VEKALTANTKVIVVQHSYGIPAAMDPILDVARARNLPVLEDCCHAFGSRYRGRLAGTLGHGSFLSGQWSKPFTTGLGGMGVIRDVDLAAKVRRVTEAEAAFPGWVDRSVISAELLVHHLLVFPRTFGLAMRMFRFLGSRGLLMASSSAHELAGVMPEGYFKRLSPAQATVGLSELKRSETNISHRRELTTYYDEVLSEAGWPTPQCPDESDPVLVRYPVPVANKAALLKMAEKHLIELGDWFECPLHGAEAPLENFGFDASNCPVADRLSREVVNLPLHLRVSKASAKRAVQFLLQHGTRCEETCDA
jgi:dTDP-4-amino-4,6-dideoxygalactose transaminase